MKIEADAELEVLVTIARLAATRVVEIYREHQQSAVEVREKSPGDPVTRADQEANDLIVTELESRLGAKAIVAEESVPTDEDELRSIIESPRVYFVDPLDGTREFINKNGEFSVMLGLAEAGRATAGVVVLPATGELFAGRVGTQAFAESISGERRLLSVSKLERFPQCKMLVSRSHRPPLIAPLRKRLGIQAPATPCGSVGVKVSRICDERAELYVHAGRGMKLWDSCAPEAILAAAGGRMSDLDGAPVNYATTDLLLPRGLVASNGVLHPGTLSAIPWAERHC